MRTDLPPVAVFEVGLPPALAFIRSLGRAGVPVRAFGTSAHAPGRYSRYVEHFDVAPDAHQIDVFLGWLDDRVERDGIALVAPTSDYMAFAVTEYDARHGTELSGGIGGDGGRAGVLDCLFKDRFARRMEEIGFPIPAWSTPTSLDEALADAERIGYPVVLKPRSHVGVGLERGSIAHDADELRDRFEPFSFGDDQSAARRHDAHLAYPLLQQLITADDVRVVSLTGYIDRDGSVRAVGCSHKTSQWGDGLGIGTMFEVLDPPPFLDHALAAVRHVLRAAIFEFEVLVDMATGRYWAIELNPRGFGQISLSVARGKDLPVEWYRSATGIELPRRPPGRRPAEQWRMGTPYFVGAALRALRGPDRRSLVTEVASSLGRPTASAMHSWADPRPGFAFAAQTVRHPGGLLRPFLDG
jgi:predicted ATP-grasp superfamily ATP-dependent carboligase